MAQKEKEQDDINFEIRFYEGILAKSPDFIQALTALGSLYTQAGHYEKGLATDQHLAQLRPDDPLVLYNLSCSYSLLGQVDKSFSVIKQAVDCGYKDFKFLEKDKDLDNLRRDNRFKDFLTGIKTQKPSDHQTG
jgi:tetratricopeptide (TPR) repeat protein